MKVFIMKYGTLLKLIFFTTLLTNIQSTQPKSNRPPKRAGLCFLKTEYGFMSREFIEGMLANYPFLSASIITSALWYNLYPEQVAQTKNFIHQNRFGVFAAACTAMALTLKNREKILTYLYPLVADAEQENSEDENYYTQFSKSGVKIFWPGEINVTFADVAGLHSAKQELSDILLFLTHPEKFQKIGARVPKGVLLCGSPGNGKTLLARALAGEANCPFLSINASMFMEAIIGVGAARVRNLFSVAKELAEEFGSCIIFMDEIDTVARQRGGSAFCSDVELSQTLNQLLSEMDGFEQNEHSIIIIGATNREDVLDEAILRPGRFDRKIEVFDPYLQDRIDILNIHLQKVRRGHDIDVEKIASVTYGFSGAELEHLVNEAAILTVRKNKNFVDMFDFEQAYDTIVLGYETKGVKISPDQKYKTAIHETGHALAHVLQKESIPLYRVSIVARGHALGVTYGMNIKEMENETLQELRAEIVTALAGSVAEELIFGHRDTGTHSDIKKARTIATALVMRLGMTDEFKDITFEEFVHEQFHLPDEISTKLHKEIAKIITECRAQAYELLNAHKAELLQVATLLVEQETINGDLVYEICGVQKPDLHFSLVK
jgi:cell division protease FtsH